MKFRKQIERQKKRQVYWKKMKEMKDKMNEQLGVETVRKVDKLKKMAQNLRTKIKRRWNILKKAGISSRNKNVEGSLINVIDIHSKDAMKQILYVSAFIQNNPKNIYRDREVWSCPVDSQISQMVYNIKKTMQRDYEILFNDDELFIEIMGHYNSKTNTFKFPSFIFLQGQERYKQICRVQQLVDASAVLERSLRQVQSDIQDQQEKQKILEDQLKKKMFNEQDYEIENTYRTKQLQVPRQLDYRRVMRQRSIIARELFLEQCQDGSKTPPLLPCVEFDDDGNLVES